MRSLLAFEASSPAPSYGLDPSGLPEVVQVPQFGPDALNVVCRVDGRVDQRLVMRGEEIGFEFVQAGRTYGFDAHGGLARLASEAVARIAEMRPTPSSSRLSGWTTALRVNRFTCKVSLPENLV